MSSISSEDIISILKEEIENYDFDSRDKEVGKVIYVGDGIVTVYGITERSSSLRMASKVWFRISEEQR